jgi:glucose/mannose-6-phosphate isomerase
MKNLILNFGTQLQEALNIASASQLKPATSPIHNVVIAGMGGSGIGGNLVTAWTANTINVPITISKSYNIPAFINANTLFIACSFSGGTEETLSATEKARVEGAQIVAITSGGKLGAWCKQHNFDQINIPGHSNSPRASIGYSFVQLLNILHFFGLTPTNHSEDIAETITLLNKEQSDIHQKAQVLAKALKGKFPIFYADSKLEAVVIRTQQQIAENSKQLSHTNVFPEMNHNELVGWMYPTIVFENVVTILLRTSYDQERSTMRMNICIDIFKKVAPELHEIHAKGSSFIAQSLYHIHLLDWVSFFLAEENNVDPFPVDAITHLKNELAKF